MAAREIDFSCVKTRGQKREETVNRESEQSKPQGKRADDDGDSVASMPLGISFTFCHHLKNVVEDYSNGLHSQDAARRPGPRLLGRIKEYAMMPRIAVEVFCQK